MQPQEQKAQISRAYLNTMRNAKLVFPGVDPSYAGMVHHTRASRGQQRCLPYV